jgi:hypothetical protein
LVKTWPWTAGSSGEGGQMVPQMDEGMWRCSGSVDSWRGRKYMVGCSTAAMPKQREKQGRKWGWLSGALKRRRRGLGKQRPGARGGVDPSAVVGQVVATAWRCDRRLVRAGREDGRWADLVCTVHFLLIKYFSNGLTLI